MNCECVEIMKGVPWLDTVDQEHIPLEILNTCEQVITVDVNVFTPSKETLYKSGVKVPGSGRQGIEVVTDKYYEFLEVEVRLKEGRDICKKSFVIRLR
ncbi:MAG: hypothetical protein QXP80_05120 [Zestosphaera sp.]